ncbi:MAG TPA: SCO6880 family protein [Acidimicrobiales bacterium]|nr:SCO6880 family protein [Acidimicrobiales bacterium]
MAEEHQYSFPPLEQRGVVAGLRSGQLLLLAAALVIGIVLLRLVPDARGIAVAALVALSATAVAFVPIRGQPLEQWAPTVARWAATVGRGGHRIVPVDGAPGLCGPPRTVRGLHVAAAPRPGAPPVAIVRDRTTGTCTAVLSVRGRSFALLETAEKQRRLAGWATVLAALAREGGPVRRVQWLERTVPGDAGVLSRHANSATCLPEHHAALESYLSLVAEAGPLGQDHECFVALTVRPPRRGPRGDAVLLRELRLLQGQLRSADVDVDRVLSPRELGALIRTAFDPWSRADLTARIGAQPDVPGPLPSRAWPTAAVEAWASWRTDATWHATFWVAEWPRTEVGPDFLAPLLLHQSAQRTVSLVMAPLPPALGVREAESARTAQVADEQLRARAGFLTTARRRREAEGVLRREADLADGHAAYRYSGYVTVTARSSEELDAACGELLQSAHQCRLELRRVYGAQAAAFVWGALPFGRGLAGK